jgi:hypothetical protein
MMVHGEGKEKQTRNWKGNFKSGFCSQCIIHKGKGKGRQEEDGTSFCITRAPKGIQNVRMKIIELNWQF